MAKKKGKKGWGKFIPWIIFCGILEDIVNESDKLESVVLIIFCLGGLGAGVYLGYRSSGWIGAVIWGILGFFFGAIGYWLAAVQRG